MQVFYWLEGHKKQTLVTRDETQYRKSIQGRESREVAERDMESVKGEGGAKW
jgi:hypothetical protein